MSVRNVSDFLNKINQIENKEERAMALKTGANITVKELININFNSQIIFDLPVGSPDLTDEFNPNNNYFPALSQNDDGATLNYEIRKMYLFIKDRVPQLTQIKRETLWIQLINSLGKDEAEVLTLVKDKKLQEKFTNIDHEVAHLAFPEFVSPPNNKKTRDGKGRFAKKTKTEEA
jgi:hypothetical protein